MDILVFSILKKKLASAVATINTALQSKADLVNNKVPLSQLPEFVVAQVITVQTYADLPATGDSGFVYNVTNDTDTSKNGAYKWIGTGYFKYTNEQNYYNVSIVGASYTMGQLATAVANINLAGQHVFFDLHEFATDAYVCLVHFTTGNHCVIIDLLNNKIYGLGQTYTAEQTVSNYVTAEDTIATKNKIKTTMDAIATVNTEYYLGSQSAVTIVLPTASAGDIISVVFYSGATSTTLTITGTYLGTAPTPATNQRIELNLLHDGVNWCLVSNSVATA